MFLSDFSGFERNVFHRTPEGYLTGRLCVTGAGVFRYLDDQGKFIGRLRSVDEVRNATGSLNGKPVTLQHPNSPVSPENAQKLSVGMSAQDAEFDGLNNFVTITITDKGAIDAIERGEVKAISCGYDCGVENQPGVWQGSRHEQAQKNIQYNHIALVREGRAGDQVRFHVGDSAEVTELFPPIVNQTPTVVPVSTVTPLPEPHRTFSKDSTMKTIQIDGVDYQADEKVIEALQGARRELADSKDAIANTQKELAAAQKEASENMEDLVTMTKAHDELEQKIGEMLSQETFDAALDKAVNERIALLDKARTLGCEVTAKDSNDEIRAKVIKKAFGDVELQRDREGYMEAMFDAACINLSRKPAAQSTQFDGAPRGGAGGHDVRKSMEDEAFDEIYRISHGLKKEGN